MIGIDDLEPYPESDLLFVLNPDFLKRKKREQKQEQKQEQEREREREWLKPEYWQEFKKACEREKKKKQRLIKKSLEKDGLIYTLSDITKSFQIDEKTFKKWGWTLYFWKQGRSYLFEKKSLYKALSAKSYKYTKGIKTPCNYDRLPEYLKIEQCAEMLGLDNGRQFKRNYIDNNPEKLEGVEILKNGSTVRIEKESFLKYAEEVNRQK